MVRSAFLLGILAAGGALASDSVSIALRVTVVPVCRFLTSASTAGPGGARIGHGAPPSGSATLTYACSSGTEAAFTFAVPATTNVACTECSDIPVVMGNVLATSLGIGQGLGSGRDRTLTVSAPLTQAVDKDAAQRAFPSRIVVTVSP